MAFMSALVEGIWTDKNNSADSCTVNYAPDLAIFMMEKFFLSYGVRKNPAEIDIL